MSPPDVAEIAERMQAAGVPLEASQVAVLQRVGTSRAHPTDAVVCREGQSSDTLYIICDGELAVTLGNGTELGRCKAGSIVGEVSFLDRGPMSATLTATLPTTILAVDRSAFEQLARDQPGVATAVLRALCVTLASRVRRSSDMFEVLSTAPPAKPPTPQSFLDVLRSLLFGTKEGA